MPPDHPPDYVIAEVREGYKLGDSVLRPSVVRVAKAPVETEKPEPEEEAGEDEETQE